MIAQRLLDTGILQIGLFAEEDKPKTYRLRLDMLPCYPALFQQIVADTAKHLSRYKFDYLLADADTSAIAGAIVHVANVPLVYSRGRGEPTALDLVGAYDVGHSALLLINTLETTHINFINQAARVGLNVETITPIIETHKSDRVSGIYTLEKIITQLQKENRLPPQQAQAILQEI